MLGWSDTLRKWTGSSTKALVWLSKRGSGSLIPVNQKGGWTQADESKRLSHTMRPFEARQFDLQSMMRAGYIIQNGWLYSPRKGRSSDLMNGLEEKKQDEPGLSIICLCKVGVCSGLSPEEALLHLGEALLCH